MQAGIIIGTNVISTLLGKQILSQAVSDASGTIYESLGSIFSSDIRIDNYIRRFDLKNRINMVEMIIKNIDNYNIVIESSITSLHDIILDIRSNLKEIENKIQLHKCKYLNRWRKIDCRTELQKLEQNSQIFDKRFDYFIKSISIITKMSNKIKKD